MPVFTRSISVCVLLLTFFLPLNAVADDSPIVKIDLGQVRGKTSSDGKLNIFLGIPYAAPPVGPLRWKPPQPAVAWTEPRDATSFGSRCMQAPLFPDMVFTDPGMSEDCLTLNIWAPVANESAKLPVMVWIYGGGFASGATSEPRQNGETLAHRGVIVVSMNYRLGILGFFASHELADESSQHAAGNYGLLDQSAALHWVQQNIAAFGGDPANITIFGESAGSFSVNLLMASPVSRQLLSHAIGESGGALGKSAVNVVDLATAEKDDEKFAKNTLHADNLAALRAVSAQELIQKTSPKPFANVPQFGPIIDGNFLPDSVSAIFSTNKQAQIPLLAGWNKNETSFASVGKTGRFTVQNLNGLAFQKFGLHAGDFLMVYRAANDEEAVRAADDFAADSFVGFGTWSWLEAQVNSGVSAVYRFSFDLGIPGDLKHPSSLGAFHSDEIEYVFGTLDSRKGYAWRPEDYKLSELIQTYWTNFAKTGNPNSDGLPNWPAYNAKDGWLVMHLGQPSSAQPDAHRDRYLFLQKAWKK